MRNLLLACVFGLSVGVAHAQPTMDDQVHDVDMHHMLELVAHKTMPDGDGWHRAIKGFVECTMMGMRPQVCKQVNAGDPVYLFDKMWMLEAIGNHWLIFGVLTGTQSRDGIAAGYQQGPFVGRAKIDCHEYRQLLTVWHECDDAEPAATARMPASASDGPTPAVAMLCDILLKQVESGDPAAPKEFRDRCFADH